ncbi:MAG: RluA family pseudouridine synthase [Clostridia bacterium]|nr:RluA family pseudouridine synthase [Clostridia bacterium]
MEKGFGLVYADKNLLVLNKPASLETCAENAEADTLQRRAEAVFGTLFPVHRLDANTTGLVLFARTEEAKAALDAAFKNRAVQKFYRCVLKGSLTPSADTLHAFLLKDEEKGRVTVLSHDAGNAKPIATAYRLLGAYGKNGAQEAEIELLSGRTHQIRAHMAYVGHPLLGDDKYGDREWNRACKTSRIHLCAVRLCFALPASSPLAYLNDMTFRVAPHWAQDESRRNYADLSQL